MSEKCESCQELEALFDMQHRREMEAIARWRAEDPDGRALTQPDYGRLLDWLWEQLKIQQEDIRELTGRLGDRWLTYSEAVALHGKEWADSLKYNPGEGPGEC